MQQTTTQLDFKSLYGGFQDTKKILNNPNGFEVRWEWPKALGLGFMNMIKIRPGLVLGIAKYKLKHDLAGSFEYQHTFIDMGFSVSGDTPYRITHEKGIEDTYHYKTGHSTINYLPFCRGDSIISSKTYIACVRIYIKPQVLKGLLNGSSGHMPHQLHNIMDGDKNSFYSRVAALTPSCHMVVRQILDCPYHGPLRRLFLESKTLELITRTMAEYLGPKGMTGNSPMFCPGDMECILKAEDLLAENLEDPPSLNVLARQVGLNKNKLNQGFRQVFGTSVFDHLRILRLERARQLLLTRQENVTEVALKVGYRHHCNFTRAFKKHFGTTPQGFLGPDTL